MISDQVKLLLIHNWGEKADALDCFAEVKFIDIFSNWACYIFALNPDNLDDIQCIIQDRNDTEIIEWTMSKLERHYNTEGEFPMIDKEFRRTKADELYKRLKRNG